MAEWAPNTVVAAPAAAAPLHSLLAAAEQPQEANDRWELGFEFCPESCGRPTAWDWSCPPSSKQPKPASAGDPSFNAFDTYTLVIDASCDCVRGFKAEDYTGRARRLLEAGTAAGVEREFWTGELKAANPHLSASGGADCWTLINGGAAVSVPRGLAALQQAVASCACSPGGRGTIHATTELAALWGHLGFLTEEGARLVTKVRRDIVVAGTGYPGTGPNGAAPPANQVWAFATSGMTQVRLGEIRLNPDNIAEALDRRINRVEMFAERSASAIWDGCCLAAVLVNLSDEIGAG